MPRPVSLIKAARDSGLSIAPAPLSPELQRMVDTDNAACELGISRRGLQLKLKRYELSATA